MEESSMLRWHSLWKQTTHARSSSLVRKNHLLPNQILLLPLHLWISLELMVRTKVSQSSHSHSPTILQHHSQVKAIVVLWYLLRVLLTTTQVSTSVHAATAQKYVRPQLSMLTSVSGMDSASRLLVGRILVSLPSPLSSKSLYIASAEESHQLVYHKMMKETAVLQTLQHKVLDQ